MFIRSFEINKRQQRINVCVVAILNYVSYANRTVLVQLVTFLSFFEKLRTSHQKCVTWFFADTHFHKRYVFGFLQDIFLGLLIEIILVSIIVIQTIENSPKTRNFRFLFRWYALTPKYFISIPIKKYPILKAFSVLLIYVVD